MLMLHEGSVHTMPTMQQQCNLHGAMFTTQCSRRKVHGARLSLTKFCVGLTTTANLTMPCLLAIRILYLA